MTPQEILEEMIDYIVNHKDNLNGNILMEMLEALSAGTHEPPDGGETRPPDGGGISI